MSDSQERIRLNVGGKHLLTTVATPTAKSCYFRCMLSGDWTEAQHNKEEIFIDRDSDLFKHILRFMRASEEGQGQVVKALSNAERSLLLEEVLSN